MKQRHYRIYGGNLRTVRWNDDDWNSAVTLREWSAKYNYSESSTYGLIAAGKLVARKIRGRWWIVDHAPSHKYLKPV